MTAKGGFNPYIVGQLTLLLGGIALGLVVLPPVIIKDRPYPSGISKVAADNDAVVEQRVKPFRVASIAVAIIGLCLGPIGWIRERPPLLPGIGMGMCTVALFWYWIVLAFTIAALIFFILIAIGVWSGGF